MDYDIYTDISNLKDLVSKYEEQFMRFPFVTHIATILTLSQVESLKIVVSFAEEMYALEVE